jgi:hypothetical protein
MAQHVSVDAADDVWVGGYPTAPSYFYKLDGETGEIIDGSGFSAAEIGCGGWGGLVDGNGILWSASQYENLLMYYNTDTGESGCISVDESYGLGVDTSGFIWNSMYSPNQVAKISPFDDDGNFNPLVVAGFPKLTVPANRSNAGLAVTPADNHVWIAKSGGAEVARLDNDGEPVKIIDLGESGEEPTGVAVDVRGRVWVTNFSSRTAMRINPTEGDDGSGAVDLTVELGENADPDNYSNMTGAVAPSGTWTVIYESDDNDTRWSKISWNSSEPDGTGIVVQARASNNAGDFDTEWTDPLIVTNGEEFDPDGPASPVGKFIQVRVTFNPNTIEEGVSPVLYDLTISSPQQVGVCDINEDAFIDLNDILPIFFTIGDSAGQNDPRDWDGDGTITIIDARGCVLDCNNPFCAPNQELR